MLTRHVVVYLYPVIDIYVIVYKYDLLYMIHSKSMKKRRRRSNLRQCWIHRRSLAIQIQVDLLTWESFEQEMEWI